MTDRVLLALIAAFALGVMVRDCVPARVRADQPAAFDRQLAEHLVRAQEQSAEALREIARAAEKCTR